MESTHTGCDCCVFPHTSPLSTAQVATPLYHNVMVIDFSKSYKILQSKSKVVPVQNVQGYIRSRSLAPFILNPNTRWSWAVTWPPGRFIHGNESRYPLSRRRCGFRIQFGQFLTRENPGRPYETLQLIYFHTTKWHDLLVEIHNRSKFRPKNQECQDRRGNKAAVHVTTCGSVERHAEEE
jgi:hypothetical protein